METIAGLIDKALMNTDNEAVLTEVKQAVHALMAKYPLYA
jgi:glycine/serine hydroxymethyltransferase